MASRRELKEAHARGTGASGLATRAARWAMVFVWATGVARGLLEGVFNPPSPLTVGAHVAVLAGVFLLTDPRDRPLGRARAAGVAVIALAGTYAATTATDSAADVWLLDFSAYLLALMLARGNVGFGLAGGVAQVAYVVAWASASGQAAAGTVEMISIPVMSYILGVMWRVVLGWIVNAERAHRTERARGEREAAAAIAATELFRDELARVREEVTPSLEAIANGHSIDSDMLTRIAVLEGAIRDRTFTPRLQHPQIVEAAARARARGVRITMVAQDGPGRALISEAAAEQIARLIDTATSGSLIISSLPTEPGAINVVAHGESSSRTTLRDAISTAAGA